MLSKENIVELLQAECAYLTAEFGVRKIGLFGSYVSDQADEASDIDIVLEFTHPIGFRFFDLVDHLEKVLGQRVDVLTPAGIESIRIKRVAQKITESLVYV